MRILTRFFVFVFLSFVITVPTLAQDDLATVSRIAQARELVLHATANLDSDAELSALLALQAVNLTHAADGTVLPEANTVLHRAVQGLSASSVRIPSANFPSEWIVNFMFSEDGTRIIYPISFDTATESGALGVTGIADINTQELLFTVPGDLIVPNASGERLITIGGTGENPELTQWNIASGTSGETVSSALIPFEFGDWTDFSSDLRYGVSVSRFGRETTVWDLASGEQIVTPATEALSGTNGLPIFSLDGALLGNRNTDGTITVLETENWTEVTHLSIPEVRILSYNFGPDSQTIITGNSDNWVSIWDVYQGEEIYAAPVEALPRLMATNLDGTRLAIKSVSNEVSVFDTQTDKVITRFTAPDSVWMTFSPDGNQLATLQYSGSVAIWNLNDSFGVQTMVNGPGDPNAGPLGVAYSPDGTRLVAASVTETPIVWDALTGQQIFKLTGHIARALTAAWSADGTHIATAGDDTNVILWDAETGEQSLTLSGHEDSIYAVVFSPDSARVASSSYDGTVRVWDVSTGALLLTLGLPTASRGVAWSADGLRIAAGTNILDGDGHVVVWDAVTGEKQLDILAGDTRMGAVAFSPDGSRILGGTLEGHAANVWDAQTGEVLLRLTYHTDLVGGVAYSPDGTQIATSSHDGTIRLWDAETGDELLTLNGAPEGIPRLAFSPDGTRLATANEDGTTRVFVIAIDEVMSLAESRLTRTLTDAECQRYLHVETCPA